MRWSPALTRGGGQGMADGAAGGGGGGAGIRGGEEEDSPEKKENGLTHISISLSLRRGCSPFLPPCNIQCIPPPVPDRVIAPLPPPRSLPHPLALATSFSRARASPFATHQRSSSCTPVMSLPPRPAPVRTSVDDVPPLPYIPGIPPQRFCPRLSTVTSMYSQCNTRSNGEGCVCLTDLDSSKKFRFFDYAVSFVGHVLNSKE